MLPIKRYIFLDIDGVLNNAEWLKTRPKGQHDSFDPQNAAALVNLTKGSKARIVISSTWREIYSLSRLRSKLRVAGVRSAIVGKTPSWPSTRSDEIAAYMAKARLELEDVLILDDDPLHELLAARQVRTDFKTGLTHADSLRGLRLWGITDG